jgi:hypothetical protein
MTHGRSKQASSTFASHRLRGGCRTCLRPWASAPYGHPGPAPQSGARLARAEERRGVGPRAQAAWTRFIGIAASRSRRPAGRGSKRCRRPPRRGLASQHCTQGRSTPRQSRRLSARPAPLGPPLPSAAVRRARERARRGRASARDTVRRRPDHLDGHLTALAELQPFRGNRDEASKLGWAEGLPAHQRCSSTPKRLAFEAGIERMQAGPSLSQPSLTPKEAPQTRFHPAAAAPRRADPPPGTPPD